MDLLFQLHLLPPRHHSYIEWNCVRSATNMASNLSLPIPPRTPTPPADDNHNDAANNPAVPIDRDALSPLRDTFPKSVSLDPGSQSLLSPTKASFNLNAGSVDMATSTNGSLDATPAGPFNFNTTVMAKAPVVKSVRALCYENHP